MQLAHLTGHYIWNFKLPLSVAAFDELQQLPSPILEMRTGTSQRNSLDQRLYMHGGPDVFTALKFYKFLFVAIVPLTLIVCFVRTIS